MKPAVWVLGSTFLMAGDVLAADRSAPLLSGDDLLAASAPGITQGSTAGSAGAVFYPDQILTVDVPEGGQGGSAADPRIQAWHKAFRFIVIPLNLGVQAKPGVAPRSVVINAAFRNAGQAPKQPIIIDLFPATGFKPEALQGSVSLGVGADLKFGGTLPANATASAKAALSYTYAPAFANVQSGYSSSACFWQFVATQAEQPVGTLPLKLTVGIPRSVKANSLPLAIDVVVGFGSSWWGDEVRTSFVTEVLLPQ